MNIIISIKAFVKNLFSSSKMNAVEPTCAINTVPAAKSPNNVHIMSVNDVYRPKRTSHKERPAAKLTYMRIYRKGMKVAAYSYDKSTGAIGSKLNVTDSIKEMAQYYMVHPSIVSNCAVYNALDEKYGTSLAKCHIRKIRKYVTPGTLLSLPSDSIEAVKNCANTITFKYE